MKEQHGNSLPQFFDEIDVRAELRRQVDAALGPTTFALMHHLPIRHVDEVLNGTAEPSIALCEALGFLRVHKYRRLTNKQQSSSPSKGNPGVDSSAR